MNFNLLLLVSALLVGCAQSQKSQISDGEPQMKKVEQEDINTGMTKKMSNKNFKEAKKTVMNVPQSVLTCSAGSDVRVLEIKSVDEKGCELQYTKNGDTKTVANANFNTSYCETVQTRISKKLEAAGFSCQ